MPFQTQVNQYAAPAVAGDFASSNPRAVVLGGEHQFVAGPGGVTVGKFAWIGDDGITVQSYNTNGAGPFFVHREQQALISTYLAEYGNTIPEGFPVTLHRAGDFFALVTGSTAATVGANVFATYANGDITIGAAATGASVTASIGATTTAAIGSTSTGTGSGTNLTLSSLTGYVSVGDIVSGTGVPAGTTIVSQTSGTTGLAGVYVTSAATTSSGDTITTFGTNMVVSAATGYISVGDTVSGGAGAPVGATVVSQASGTTGGAGTYVLSAPATAYLASGTVTTFGSKLHVTAVASGTLVVGDVVSAPATAVIDSQIDGTAGGVGNYQLDTAATAYTASGTVTSVGGVDTGWDAQSAAAVGELTKISTW
jgi:hypothetical protein